MRFTLNKKQLYIIYLPLAVILLNVLPVFGWDIPILRPVIGFVFITLVPGYLILYILRAYNLGIVRTLALTVGLSIAFIMFTNVLTNLCLPWFGLNEPISLVPVTAASGFLMVILVIMAYLRNKKSEYPESLFPLKSTFDFNIFLFLMLLPLLAVLGAELVTSRISNMLLLVLIPVIGIFAIWCGFKKFIPPNMLPLAVFSISSSLLLHQSLITNYLAGWDIHLEYYLQGLVITNGYWDPTIPVNYNAMLSITMLCPIYSIVMKLDSVWVLKIIYPLLFSLVPVILFEVYKEYCEAKIAFWGTFVFMSMWVFFTEMLALARQEIAEIFFSLLLLLIIEKKLTNTSKNIIILAFLASLTVSHYGLTYIAIALFGMGWLLISLSKIKFLQKAYKILINRIFPHRPKSLAGDMPALIREQSFLKWYFLLFFLEFVVLWYCLVASGTPIITIGSIGQSLYSKFSEFFLLGAREPLISTAVGLDWGHVSLYGKLFRIIQYIIEIGIVMQLVNIVLNLKTLKMNIEYTVISLTIGLVLFACIAVPYFSSYLDVSRIFHISLIILSPFCILGLMYSWRIVVRLFSLISPRMGLILSKPLFAYSLILILIFSNYLFYTGFIFEIAKVKYAPGQIPSTMALSDYREDFPDYYANEACGARWLAHNSEPQTKVSGDVYSELLLWDYLVYTRVTVLPEDFNQILPENYVYLRPWNVENNKLLLYRQGNFTSLGNVAMDETNTIEDKLNEKKLVYNNKNTQILAP